MAGKLSDAQRRKLGTVPNEWGLVPLFGDMRPIAPLLRMGLIEERETDTTPADWSDSPVRWIRHEWRLTDAGRTALEDKP